MQISVQMYSVRDALAEDYQAAVGRLVDLGFSVAEPFALLERRDDLVRARESHDISFPSAHQSFLGDGDFAPVQNNLIENNLFTGGGGGGSTICAYGGSSGNDGSKPYGNQARDIRFINNVFVRGASGQCGNLGAVKSFDAPRPGNVWRGNTWDNGATINGNGR